jgi:DNA-binding transcriptional MerR regulator/methylmalonyl-CoA mutase cobalamin-binding subunit
MAEAHHAIKAVSRRTGLTTYVIRVWEKRYGAVEPERTGTNRRLYSDQEVERLALLRDVTHAGHSISAVAKLPTEKLRRLASESRTAHATNGVETNGHSAPAVSSAQPAATLLEECIRAVKALDSRGLDETLHRGETDLGAQGLLQKVIAPLAQRIGALWRDGEITAAHEHFASAVLRMFLGHAAKPFGGIDNAPVLVVATPSGQLHELGALLVGAAAANVGWHVTYLGASLPAAEIAGACRQNRARALALSLVYPEDDPRLEGELTRLRDLLPTEVTLLVGGRAMPAYGAILARIGATRITDLGQLCTELDELRRPKSPSAP